MNTVKTVSAASVASVLNPTMENILAEVKREKQLRKRSRQIHRALVAIFPVAEHSDTLNAAQSQLHDMLADINNRPAMSDGADIVSRMEQAHEDIGRLLARGNLDGVICEAQYLKARAQELQKFLQDHQQI